MSIRLRSLAAVAAGVLAVGVGFGGAPAGASTGASGSPLAHLDCGSGRPTCTEVQDAEAVFGEGHYVGHDEPSLLFYSNQPGSGNRVRYTGVLPTDPAPTPLPGQRSYTFMQGIAFWYGMAMCDTQSYPEQLSTCTPDSDTNIVAPTNSQHAGTAFTELQFYPPGWVAWPPGVSCSATQWCVALNIDSLSLNPVTGQANNNACLSQAGIEPVNFAFLTRNGIAHAPASPLLATVSTFTPQLSTDLFLNPGDHYTVTMTDSPHGLVTTVTDTTTGQVGSMTASAANGFGQVKFDPTATTCTNIPADFHPMYATSSTSTRVPWAAHSYNIAFDDEIGHFDYCSHVPTDGGSCVGHEGAAATAPGDPDDNYCFRATSSTLVPVSGCLDSNVGFDGQSYQNLWPDGTTGFRPSPLLFTAPATGPQLRTPYAQVGFETDLPRIEVAQDGSANNCDRATGSGCLLIPLTDTGQPAAFYPYFSTDATGCTWTIGQDVAGFTANDYGKNAQYGPLLKLTYTAVGGGTSSRYNDFRNIIDNPCTS